MKTPILLCCTLLASSFLPLQAQSTARPNWKEAREQKREMRHANRGYSSLNGQQPSCLAAMQGRCDDVKERIQAKKAYMRKMHEASKPEQPYARPTCAPSPQLKKSCSLNQNAEAKPEEVKQLPQEIAKPAPKEVVKPLSKKEAMKEALIKEASTAAARKMKKSSRHQPHRIRRHT